MLVGWRGMSPADVFCRCLLCPAAVPAALMHQAVADPDKLSHCLAVARRGLSDLRSYAAMTASADSGEMSITLKGATG